MDDPAGWTTHKEEIEEEKRFAISYTPDGIHYRYFQSQKSVYGNCISIGTEVLCYTRMHTEKGLFFMEFAKPINPSNTVPVCVWTVIVSSQWTLAKPAHTHTCRKTGELTRIDPGNYPGTVNKSKQ